MLATEPFTDISSSSDAVVYSENGSNHSLKRRRRPAGTPDPDAEVVSLSPETLMESDHYVCEICNQGFQREQNLQMHRRRHKIPWKLLKGEAKEHRKRVYVCPELTCLHHDPCHALGDLVGIKKHFRRKHSNHKQWVCHKCSKGYAVQSDYKAHLKTCGTRGHSCDCGRVFSRVDTFMEHQDICKATTMTNYTELKPTTPVSVLQTLRPVPHNTENLCRSDATWNFATLWQKVPESACSRGSNQAMMSYFNHNMEVEPIPFPSSNSVPSGINLPFCANSEEYYATQLKLSVGSSSLSPIQEQEPNNPSSKDDQSGKANFKARICVEDQEPSSSSSVMVSGLIEDAREQLQIAMHEKALAEQKRQQAKWQVQLAEEEFKRANQIRQQALAELNKAQVFKDLATKDNNSKILQITCHSCKKQFQKLENGDNSSGQSYISSVMIITGREKEKDLINHWEISCNICDI